MNIKEAKQEVKNTVRAYLMKDETGLYEIPTEKQRPVLLIGPPGIGKTAIMEQIAAELGINLVSYTITHHTRQSAIGLPFIAKKEFGGEEYSVTEYTMSEILASVYEQIEKSGISEGILFLDEINCVSETLAPTMLQFLQYKTFGSHRLPEGFVVVTAGNPPQYNKSVRDFDIVTLDRVKKIYVSEDLQVFREYALGAGIHGAILAYLEIKKKNFYVIRPELEETYFVTARGWEDLSRILKVYEKMEIPVTAEVAGEYLQDPEVARDFVSYYELYRKYQTAYRIPEVLEGWLPEDVQELKNAPFDEKLSLIGLLCDALNQEFREYAAQQSLQQEIFGEMKSLLAGIREGEACGTAAGQAEEPSTAVTDSYKSKEDKNSDGAQGSGMNPIAEGAACKSAGNRAVDVLAGLMEARRLRMAKTAGGPEGDAAKKAERRVMLALEDLQALLRGASVRAVSENPQREDRNTGMAADAADRPVNAAEAPARAAADSEAENLIRQWFSGREDARQAAIDAAGTHLTNTFRFLSRVYGEGQEMVIFLTELSDSYYSLKFVRECGNEAYYRYNRLLLMKGRSEELRREVMELI